MAADALIATYHGASPGTPVDVTNSTIRWKRADNDAQDALDPIPVPTAGFAYSWRKSFKVRVASIGPDNAIRNLRFYSEGQDLGTDRIFLIATAGSYTQGSTGDETAAISAVDVDSYTSTAPLVVNAGQVFGPSETGDGSQDFVEIQARIGPAATAGNVAAAKGLAYRYDET